MRIHKEGFGIILIAASLCAGIVTLNFFFLCEFLWLFWLINLTCLAFFILIAQFFRVPSRKLAATAKDIVCPADGKVVVIEETDEPEYFKDKRIQISIFMSPLNVHVQWYPVSGKTMYYKYHPGQFLVAWHPKSSTLNERTTLVIRTESGNEILVRQIAGAVARRIKCYAKTDQLVKAGDEFGFIKFGSRVDVFLPLGTDIKVALGQVVKGMSTLLA